MTGPGVANSSEGLWAFSLRIYARPGVAQACLALQDKAGMDVNLLLFALWTASRGQRLTAADMARVDAATRPWREGVVRPLRAARRALKAQGGTEAAQQLRNQVKRAELEAERLQQAAMEALLPPQTERMSDAGLARANLAAYADGAGLALPDAETEVLAQAIRSSPAFPE